MNENSAFNFGKLKLIIYEIIENLKNYYTLHNL